MTREEIPEFILALLHCGCTVMSVGDTAYVIDDAPVVNANEVAQGLNLYALIKRYGPRDHLKADIIQYLRNSGNCIDIRRAAVWPAIESEITVPIVSLACSMERRH